MIFSSFLSVKAMGEESGNIESALGINLSSFTYKVNKSVDCFSLLQDATPRDGGFLED